MEGRHLKLIYEFELSIHNSYSKDCLTLNHNSSHSILQLLIISNLYMSSLSMCSGKITPQPFSLLFPFGMNKVIFLLVHLCFPLSYEAHNSYSKDCLTLNHNSSHSIHNNLLSQVQLQNFLKKIKGLQKIQWNTKYQVLLLSKNIDK